MRKPINVSTSQKWHNHLSRFQSIVQWNTKKVYLPHASPKLPQLWQPLIPQDYVIWSPIRPSNYSRSGRTCCTFQVIRKRPRKNAAYKKLHLHVYLYYLFLKKFKKKKYQPLHDLHATIAPSFVESVNILFQTINIRILS